MMNFLLSLGFLLAFAAYMSLSVAQWTASILLLVLMAGFAVALIARICIKENNHD